MGNFTPILFRLVPPPTISFLENPGPLVHDQPSQQQRHHGQVRPRIPLLRVQLQPHAHRPIHGEDQQRRPRVPADLQEPSLGRQAQQGHHQVQHQRQRRDLRAQQDRLHPDGPRREDEEEIGLLCDLKYRK